MSGNAYTVHARLNEVEKITREALQLSKDAHTRIDRAACKGETGERGLRGEPGRDAISIPGKDGQPGRDAVGIQGPPGATGAAGRDGRDAPQRAEFDNLKFFVEKECRELRSAFEALSQDFDTLSRAFTSASQKTQEYLQWLQERADARRKAKQQ
jgi:hypothetical protein